MENVKKLWPSQEVALELLDLVEEVCKENNLTYMLIEDSALAAYVEKGFLKWTPRVTIGLFYEEYVRFLSLFEEKYKGTKYYTMTGENTPQFEELYARICKRSRVILGEGREQDEKYYDFYIIVKPIFYAGDTIKEYKKFRRCFISYTRCLYSDKINKKLLQRGRVKIKYLVRTYYYFRRNKYTFKHVFNTLTRNNEKTKYVFIPDYDKSNPKGMEIKYFENPERQKFCDREVYVVKDIESYVGYRYGKKIDEVINHTPMIKFELIGGEILRRIQLIETELLCEFDRICRKNGIKYILGAGTALGAYRHKGFVPWDDDVDVFMLYEEYEKFLKIADEELDNEKYFLKTQESDKDCNLTYTQLKRNDTKYSKANRERFSTHPGVLIDILPIFNAPKNPIKRMWQNRICKFYKTMTWSHIGAYSERNKIKKWYYLKLAKKGNKYAFNKFMKYATCVKEPSEGLTFIDIWANFTNNPVNWRKTYENLQEVEFEGKMFYATKDLDSYLEYAYGYRYKEFLPIFLRTSKHAPAVIEIGDLYKYAEEEDNG